MPPTTVSKSSTVNKKEEKKPKGEPKVTKWQLRALGVEKLKEEYKLLSKYVLHDTNAFHDNHDAGKNRYAPCQDHCRVSLKIPNFARDK